MTKSRAWLIVALALLLVVLHVAGLFLEFYWRVGWFYRAVHTLAGATAALAVLSLGWFKAHVRRPVSVFLSALLISLVIGVLWEVFEVKAGINHFGDPGYALYTAWDIICDVIGGCLAGLYLISFP